MKKSKPNIILIVIDALRARNLGCYGMSSNPSPNIDQVARNSILFDGVYSCWNTTDQSLTSILSGKYPRSHGIMNHGDKVKPAEIDTLHKTNTKLLAQILKQASYNTMAVDWMGRWFKQGFDYYGYEIERHGWEKFSYFTVELPKLYINYMLGHLPILKCYRPMRKPTFKDIIRGMKDVLSTFAFTFNLAKLQDASYVTQIAEGLIKQQTDDPFFLFLHYWDTHTPYNCPKDFLNNTKDISDPKSLLISKYHGAVRYVDFQLGKLFDILKKQKRWENTLLIITSDHGDSLTEHDIFFDHHGLYEETTHVPLILHYPESFTAGKRINSFVQHIDLVPTISDLIGSKYQQEEFDGQSLVPLIHNKIDRIRDHVFIEESYVQKKSALRTNKYKYIKAYENDGWCNYCQKVHVGKEELYDLKNDPGENHDIAQENRSIAKQMNDELLSLIKNLDEKREAKILNSKLSSEDDNQIHDPQEEALIRKRFKNLGYL